jgi:nitrate/nitrite transporter NarK
VLTFHLGALIRALTRRLRDERGAVTTTEIVYWAVAILAIIAVLSGLLLLKLRNSVESHVP